jgi:hypothetical protein
MKRVVLTFGLIAGAILSAMMLVTLPFHDAIGFDRAEIIGYSTLVVAFLLVFSAYGRTGTTWPAGASASGARLASGH